MSDILYFPFLGPNRHSDRKVVEVRLDFGTGLADRLFDAETVLQALCAAGVLKPGETFLAGPLPPKDPERAAALLAQLALWLQQWAGHRVSHWQVMALPSGDRWAAVIEHDHCDVGMTAVKLAAWVMTGHRPHLDQAVRDFLEFAAQRQAARETGAIMKLAWSRDISAFQLEQPPFPGKRLRSHRVRQNGLLMLGNGCYTSLLDGSFCEDRADDDTRAMLTDTAQRAQLLERLGLPRCEPPAVETDVLAVGRERFSLCQGSGAAAWRIDGLSPGQHTAVARISDALGGQAVRVSLGGGDEPGVADFELGPDLSVLHGAGPGADDALLERAAAALLDWLYPDPVQSRVPVVAITGTNGKTTTSRMTSHILQVAGLRPGLVCTDGIFYEGERLFEGDHGSFPGHTRVLFNRNIHSAVLESHHRGIAVHGFPFRRCEVAMCLNVTEEHIKEGEVESVAEMATIKGAVPARGRTAVLFADDPHCRAMICDIEPEALWLVSLVEGLETLRRLAGAKCHGFCVIEVVDDCEHIVLYERGERIPLMPVRDIPASFDGAARFNVSNAMHAAVAAHAVGVSTDTIRTALSGFHAGAEMTPGRMNELDGLPFRLILDFSHTPDGLEKISAFVDAQEVDGRKIVVIAGSPGRDVAVYRDIGRAVAGHFDLYVCKEYSPRPGLPENFNAQFLKQGLIDAGVSEDQIHVTGHGRDAAFDIFDQCRRGDLVFYTVGHVEKGLLAGFVEEYRARV